MLLGVSWLDANGWSNPDNSDEGTQAERDMRVGEGRRNCNQISQQRVQMLALDRGVLRFEFAGEAKTTANGQAQQQKAEAGDDHRRSVKGYREGVHLFFKDIRREEGQQRETKEKEKIRIEDEFVSLLGAVDEMVMMTAITPSEKASSRAGVAR